MLWILALKRSLLLARVQREINYDTSDNKRASKSFIVIGDDKWILIMLSAIQQTNQKVYNVNKNACMDLKSAKKSSNITREILPFRPGDKSDIKSLSLQGFRERPRDFTSYRSRRLFVTRIPPLLCCLCRQNERFLLVKPEVTTQPVH